MMQSASQQPWQQQSFTMGSTVGTGSDTETSTFLFSQVLETSRAVKELELKGSGDPRFYAVRIRQDGLYHVSAAMRFGRFDRLHIWGITLDSHRLKGERNVMNLPPARVLARTILFDAPDGEDHHRAYMTLSWTGALAQGNRLRVMGDGLSTPPRLYQGMKEDSACYLRVNRLGP